MFYTVGDCFDFVYNMCVQTAREDWWLDHFKVKRDMLMENIARRLVLIILKGVTMDDKGNVYVADTLNLAII